MSAAGADRTPETAFQVNRITAWIWVIFGFAAALYGIAIVVYFAYLTEDVVAPVKVSVAVCGGVLTFIGQYFAREALCRLRDPQAPIVIGLAGLHDRALTAHPVPWSAISGVAIRFANRGGRFVALEIAPAALDTSGAHLGPRIEALFNRALGYPGFRIHMLGVKADPDRLIAAITPYARVG